MQASEIKGVNQRFDFETFGLDAGMGWRSGAMFLNASAGVSLENFDDIRRDTTVPVVHIGETDGVSRGARLQAGTWIDTGGLAISPRVAVTWSSTDVDGYTEQGVAAQYRYEDRTVEGMTAEASLRAEGDFGGMTFFIEGGYRDSLDDSSGPVGTGIAGSPSQVLYRDVEEPFGGQVLAAAGLEGNWAGARVTIGYRGRYGDNAESHVGGINFSLPLP